VHRSTVGAGRRVEFMEAGVRPEHNGFAVRVQELLLRFFQSEKEVRGSDIDLC
jgi:hypothetical protein